MGGLILFYLKKKTQYFFPHIPHGICVLNRTKIRQLKFYFENENHIETST